MYGSYYGYGHMGRIGFRGYSLLGSSWWYRGLMIGLILVGIAIVVLLAVQLSRRSTIGQFRSEDPLQMVKKRYAQGEISREEFELIKNNLS